MNFVNIRMHGATIKILCIIFITFRLQRSVGLRRNSWRCHHLRSRCGSFFDFGNCMSYRIVRLEMYLFHMELLGCLAVK